MSDASTEAVVQESANIPPVQENVTPISQAKKPSKVDIKRHNQRVERRRRLINSGIPEDKVDALMAKQDYEAMPTDKRLARLEAIVQNVFQGMSQDMMNLRRNDGAISEAFDINYRAIVKMFAKLGVTAEQHKEIMEEVQIEMANERQAQAEAARKAQEEAQLAANAEAEKAKVEAELTNNKPVEAEGTETPEGATEFSG